MQIVEQNSFELFDLTPNELNTNDCISLWKAVVRQVALDLELLISQAKAQQAKLGFVDIQKNQQLEEILADVADEHFQDCCENAELEITRVRQYVKNLIIASNWDQFVFGTPVKHTVSGRCLKAA